MKEKFNSMFAAYYWRSRAYWRARARKAEEKLRAYESNSR